MSSAAFFSSGGGSAGPEYSKTLFASTAPSAANTGNTSENTIYTVEIPANTLPAGSQLKIKGIAKASVNDASVKSLRVKIGGTTIVSVALASTNGAAFEKDLFVTGAADSWQTSSATNDQSQSSATLTNQTFDWTAAQTVTVTLQNALNADSTTIYQLRIMAFGPGTLVST